MNHDEIIALPDEPAGPVWDEDGRKWERQPDGYWASPCLAGDLLWSTLLNVYGPLSTTPPAREGEMCPECSTGNPYRQTRRKTDD